MQDGAGSMQEDNVIIINVRSHGRFFNVRSNVKSNVRSNVRSHVKQYKVRFTPFVRSNICSRSNKCN